MTTEVVQELDLLRSENKTLIEKNKKLSKQVRGLRKRIKELEAGNAVMLDHFETFHGGEIPDY